MLPRELKTKIASEITVYPEEEALEIAYLVVEKLVQLNKIQIQFSELTIDFDKIRVSDYISKINSQEPIQYILGESWFRNRKFYVDKNVLIPRPETEEIIDLAIVIKPKTILDLGTGSGCIAISVSIDMPDSEVFAVDISKDAINVAQKNAIDLLSTANIKEADILNFKNPFTVQSFDLIISNPPYVKNNEKSEMRANVLSFEPHLALFVEDHDPLIFYKKIAEIGRTHLSENGYIIVEINSTLGQETLQLFYDHKYKNIKLKKDFYGRNRFIIAQL